MPGNTPAPYPGKNPRKKPKDELINTQIGTYIITDVIASGGMGKVYRGYKNPWAEVREKYAAGTLGKNFLDTILASASANKETAQFKKEEDRVHAQLSTLSKKFLQQKPEERENAYALLRETLDSGEIEGAKRAIKVVKKELLADLDAEGYLGKTLKPEPELLIPEGESDWYGDTLTDKAPDETPVRKKDSASTSRLLDRFVREISIAKKLKHPNIVQGVETGTTDDGMMFIAMEYVENAMDLGRVPLLTGEVMMLGRQVNSALQYAHDVGIIHRDVKPDNILARRVKGGLEAKLTDFGIASMAEQKGKGDLTKTQEMLGTPNFLSPEMARSEPTTEKSDVYSLGATLYHLLTGEPPLDGKTDLPAIVYFLTTENEPKWLRDDGADDVSEDVEDAVMMMLAKNQEERLSTQGVESVMQELFESNAFSKSVRSDDNTTELKSLRKQVSGFGFKKKGVEAAEVFEQIGKLLPRDVAGARERMNAFTKARNLYVNAGDEDLQDRVELLESRIALERRRLSKLGAAPADTEKPGVGKRVVKTIAALGIAGTLVYAGVTIAKDQMLKSDVDAAYESAVVALEGDDFKQAEARLRYAMELAEDLPKSSERVKNIESLVVRLENERNHYHAELSFEESRAVLRTSDKDKYERASELLSRAQSFAEKLPEEYREFKTNLDLFTVQIDNHRYVDNASRLYERIPGLLDTGEFLLAADRLVQVQEALKNVEDARGGARDKVESLSAKVEQAEETIGPHEPYIEIYRGLERTVESVSEDVSKFEEKVENEELFERSALTALDESASRAYTLLRDRVTIKPSSIGSPLEALQERAKALAEEAIPALLESYDSQQTSYVTARLDTVDGLLEITKDYTGGIDQQLVAAQTALSEAKSRSEQVVDESLIERLTALEAQYNALETDRKQFVAWAEQGDEGLVKRARAYLLFDHLAEAKSELEKVAEADVSLESSIISYATLIQDESKYVQRTPSGLTADIVSAYADTITWAREQNDYSNIKDMLSVLEQRGVDVVEAQDSVRRIREIRESLSSLEGDALAEAQRRLNGHFAVLDGVKTTVETVVQESAVSLPPWNAVQQLADLYRQIGYEQKAETVLAEYTR